MTNLAEYISNIARSSDDMKRDFGMAGSVMNFFNAYTESIAITDPYTIVNTRTLGSSFILGHPGLDWLGPVNAASLACGSQPYLGDSRTSWVSRRVSSPNNTFIEAFNGSRFIDVSARTILYTTGYNDIVADDYVYRPAAQWLRFKISDFSRFTVSSASLIISCGGTNPVPPGTLDIWYINIGDEYQDFTPAATLLSYATGAKITETNPWYDFSYYMYFNVKTLFDISHNAGSEYLTIKIRDARFTTNGSSLGTNNFLLIGSAGGFVANGSNAIFYDRNTWLDYIPRLVIGYDIATTTTADISSGSIVFGDGEAFQTKSIYIGSSPLSNIKLNLLGSTLGNLQIMATPNNTQWETCNSASVTPYNFTNTGSNLALRFTASGGNAIMTKYEGIYGLQ